MSQVKNSRAVSDFNAATLKLRVTRLETILPSAIFRPLLSTTDPVKNPSQNVRPHERNYREPETNKHVLPEGKMDAEKRENDELGSKGDQVTDQDVDCRFDRAMYVGLTHA